MRSAQAMGADDRRLFHKVILPGALPYILTGLRLGLAQAWRILVGVEMLAAVPWGLGWMIFGAREFLNTDVMLAGVAVIGAIGLALGEAGVPAARAVHRRALGDDDMSTPQPSVRVPCGGRPSRWSLAAAVYEATARSGLFPAALLPTLPAVGRALGGWTCWTAACRATRPARSEPRAARHGAGGRGRPAARHPDGPLSPGRGLLPAAGERADADPVAGLGAGVHPLVRPRQRHRHRHRLLRGAVPDAAQRLVGRARRQPAVAARRQRHGCRRAARCSGR